MYLSNGKVSKKLTVLFSWQSAKNALAHKGVWKNGGQSSEL